MVDFRQNGTKRKNDEAPSADDKQWLVELDRLITESKEFRQMALDVSRYIHQKLIGQDEATREAADAMHGKQLGHPLHPMLTDITIGSWTLALFFDILGVVPGFSGVRRFADSLTALGVITAVPTALTGMADYSAIKKDAVSYGAAHGLLNGAAFFCYVCSVLARMTGKRGNAFFYASLGSVLVSVSSWLGGDLVYRHRVGVNHVPDNKTIEDWTPVMPMIELAQRLPVRVEVDGVSLLLFRRDDEVSAIHSVCSHAGGPLEDGRVVDDVCIECPWHHSIFDMRDGHVVHSPAVYDQPSYDVRVRDGQIEVRMSTETEIQATRADISS